MVSQSMHEISACKLRTVQPYLVAVLTFAVLTFALLVCRRFDQAPTRHFYHIFSTLFASLSNFFGNVKDDEMLRVDLPSGALQSGRSQFSKFTSGFVV